MMMSFDYDYQNALRQAIVVRIFLGGKNRSCVTQIYITKIAAKCIPFKKSLDIFSFLKTQEIACKKNDVFPVLTQLTKY